MKLNIALGILVAIMSWVTCKNLQKSQTVEPAPAATAAPSDPGPNGWNAARVVGEARPDTAGINQVSRAPRMVHVPVDALPPASASHKAYLASAYWHLSQAVQPTDTSVHHNYQKKWLRFREDQTFDILADGQTLDTGRWNWDQVKNEIYLSCNDPYVNNTWVVNDRSFVMIWKGNTALNVTGIQIKVQGHRTLPWE
ncbi:MAG: hypothetical protein IPM98_11200 [Lewinellaceae bacterium]|nr:hypothetical protein [Lewinellaceae bacterium]